MRTKRIFAIRARSCIGQSASNFVGIMAGRIEDYALIGDMESAALVDRSGSIDWLCWPNFSSAACFAALLGTEENGRWQIAPAEGKFTATRRYAVHSLVLETIFEQDGGAVKLTDFMPPKGTHSDVVRIVRCLRGTVSMRMELKLRFDYGRTVPWVTGIEDGIRAIAGPNLAMLHASVPVRGENLKTVADFTVGQGRARLVHADLRRIFRREPAPIDAEQALKGHGEVLDEVGGKLQLQRQIPRHWWSAR